MTKIKYKLYYSGRGGMFITDPNYTSPFLDVRYKHWIDHEVGRADYSIAKIHFENEFKVKLKRHENQYVYQEWVEFDNELEYTKFLLRWN